jgi:hypothetical protein
MPPTTTPARSTSQRALAGAFSKTRASGFFAQARRSQLAGTATLLSRMGGKRVCVELVY